MTPMPLHAANLEAGNIRHGFFGRAGGVSQGIYASLNCGPGSGDAREAVIENRRRALDALAHDKDAKLLTLHQTHSTDILGVRKAWELNARPRADGMVTNQPHLALGILTADCAPVLLADADAHVIGAAHAGWKGAAAGVLEAAITAMKKQGAKSENIRAAIGPCISQSAYEVGPEFIARFRDADPQNTQFFVPSPKPDHWQFDLETYIAQRLQRAGVGDIEPLHACSYARENDFFSYRRATHHKEADYGRQLAAIMLTA